MGKELGVNADLLHSQQGIFQHLGGGNGGSEGAHRSGATAHSVPTGIPSRTMRDLHNGQNPVSRREWAEVSRPSDRLSDLRHPRSRRRGPG
jgi:hypothetical protein